MALQLLVKPTLDVGQAVLGFAELASEYGHFQLQLLLSFA